MSDPNTSTSAASSDEAIERFNPEALHGGMLAAEHMARYRWATQFVAGKRVLDAACGTAYGTAMLASAGAAAVVGIDIDEETIVRARERYGEVEQLDVGDVCALPYDDASFDVVVSFETIEHVADPESVLDEFRRVLRPGGVLVISTPNNLVYTPGNPHHLREFASQEFVDELARRFDRAEVRRQHSWVATGILNDAAFASTETDELSDISVRKLSAYQPGQETYTIVIAGGEPRADERAVVALNEPVELREWDVLWHEQAEVLASQDRQLTEQDRLLREQAELLTRQADQLRDQADAIRAQVDRGDALDAEVAKLRAALLATESDLANRHEIEFDLSRAQHVLDLLREEGERKATLLSDAIDAAVADRDRWIRDYEVVVNSSSWKVTVPWRKLGGYVRGRRARGA